MDKARNALRERLNSAAQQVEARTEVVYARVQERSPDRVRALRQRHAQAQIQSRNYSTQRVVNTAIRYFTSEATHVSSKPLRSNLPASRTRSAISNLTSRTPFASTLRPNLTGGTLCRSAGGYNLGAGRVGGVRYFSHGPAQPAEVIQNVSQAVRAFWLNGHKARFDGYSSKTGGKRYRAVSPAQDKARQAFDACHAHSAGGFVDFKISPTVTAVGPLASVPRATTSPSSSCTESVTASQTATIADEYVMNTLAIDFARALKDLAAVMNDLKRLAVLGALPLLLINETTLRVRFPGCDADTVESLCTELGIRRGIVGQDEDFEVQHGAEMALLFPFAPSKPASDADHYDLHGGRPTKRPKRDNVDWSDMLSPARVHSPSLSAGSFEFETISPRANGQQEDVIGYMSANGEIVANPWLSDPRPVSLSDYESLHPSETEEDVAMYFRPDHRAYSTERGHDESQAEYEGIEGIYRFIEQCDHARR